ncbi:hypothetical protein [Ferrimonas kyonanensis]|uniref:hypothetical protein n=1 Tax=Ferrimonas kyonanensis TaxID=364763 RepID=UPI0004839469|nr:hypothetical protein [Ferrimonas kyonanensis]
MNFKGEVYEASFLENMVGKINDLFESKRRIVSKGPYTPKNNKYKKTGFFCDQRGRILYNSNKISLAEFDCIEISENSLLFYECTLTQKSENLRVLKKEAIRKLTLLNRIFPGKKVVCKVVSDNPVTLKYFDGLDCFSTLFYGFPSVSLDKLARESRPERIGVHFGMVSANSLNNRMVEFDYIKEFQLFNSNLFKNKSLESIKIDLLSSKGLYPRLYWGKVRVDSLGDEFVGVKSEYTIVSVNFSKINSPKIRYYFIGKGKASVYEAFSPEKKLNKMKSSRAEITKIYSQLPERTIDDLKALKDEVLEWHEKTLI